MQYILDIKSPLKRKWIDAILPGIIKELGLDKSKHIVLVSVVSNDPSNEGATIALPGIDSYIVTLNGSRKKKLKDLTLTLCHEMVHVKQMASGLMKSVEGGQTWKGKFYPEETKYLDRPWEIQAFARQELLMRRVVEG